MARVYGSIYRLPFYFEEVDPLGPVACTVNETRHEYALRNQLISALQQREWVDSRIYMQDGVPPHIATPAKQILNMSFGK